MAIVDILLHCFPAFCALLCFQASPSDSGRASARVSAAVSGLLSLWWALLACEPAPLLTFPWHPKRHPCDAFGDAAPRAASLR